MPQYDKETIALQWKNLQEGKPVDSHSIRPEILASWKYSKGLGIDAYKGLNHKGDGDALVKRSAELITVAQPFMQMM